jgi:hypothetical protein
MTNNKQQTAVEWFAQQLYETLEIKGDGYVIDSLLDLAKAMHREEHFNTWWHSISENEPISFDQYYNETYGNDKQ